MSNKYLHIFIFVLIPFWYVSQKHRAYFFLYEKCPICITATMEISNLQSQYGDSVDFIGVFPNQLSTSEEVSRFESKFKIKFDSIIIDSNLNLVHQFNAKITPEVFFTSNCGEILYQGRINNQYASVGKRRAKSTSNDLENAMKSFFNHQEIEVTKTEAIGCIITQ